MKNTLHIRECTRCGHHWPSRLRRTRQCPKCHSRQWDRTEVEQVEQDPTLIAKRRDGQIHDLVLMYEGMERESPGVKPSWDEAFQRVREVYEAKGWKFLLDSEDSTDSQIS